MRIEIAHYYDNIKTPGELVAVFLVIPAEFRNQLIEKYGKKFEELIPDATTLFKILDKVNAEGRKMLCENITLDNVLKNAEEVRALTMRLFSGSDKIMILGKLNLSRFITNAKELSEILEWLDEKGKEYLLKHVDLKKLIRNVNDFCQVARHLGGVEEIKLIKSNKKILKQGITGEETLIMTLNALSLSGDLFLVDLPFIKKLQISKHRCANYLPKK